MFETPNFRIMILGSMFVLDVGTLESTLTNKVEVVQGWKILWQAQYGL